MKNNDYIDMNYELYKIYLDLSEAIACCDDTEQIEKLMNISTATAIAYAGLNELIEGENNGR